MSNNLVKAFNTTATTTNGCAAHHSSLSANLDLFYLAGASRGKNIELEFIKALTEDQGVALRTLQWLRDVREGAGERQLFKDLFKTASQFSNVIENLTPLIHKLHMLGRMDDLLWIYENVGNGLLKTSAISEFANQLKANNGLAFKWCPIKGDTAKALRKALGFKKEADWRKYVVAGRKTVEQQMCAKDWDSIEFNKVPSVAAARYQKAFKRNAEAKYGEYVESLVKGETTINAGAVYPYDIVKSVNSGVKEVANEQWKALPNYLEGNKERTLPIIDVSGSMGCPAGGSKSVTCMDVAVSLGLYLAEKQEGIFKDVFMTFHSQPQLMCVSTLPTLDTRLRAVYQAPWGMSTDLYAVFYTLLATAKKHELIQEDMPTKIVIFSDMQFNSCTRNGEDLTAYQMIEAEYAASGYKKPDIIFWNLNAANKSIPVTKGTGGTVLVSGFSPTLMKTVLSGESEPETMMLKVLMNERYNL